MEFRNRLPLLDQTTTTASNYRWLGISITNSATLVFINNVTKWEINWRMEKGSSVSERLFSIIQFH
jgi:hypothetical protein